MNRLILALMALLAGLTTQVAPSAARVNEGTEIGATAGAQLLERQAAVLAAVVDARSVPMQELAENKGCHVLVSPATGACSVRIGSDRARE